MQEMKRTLISGVGLAVLLRLTEPVTAAELPVAMPVKAPRISAEYGVYVGGYLGDAWGNSNWTTAPDVSGSLNLTQRIDPFDEAGNSFAGLQFGYDYMLPNRVVIGAVADATIPAFKISLESPSTARRSSRPRPSGRKATARRCSLPALCALASVTRREPAFLWDRRVCLDPRSADADATRHRHDRHVFAVAFRLGGWGRRRGPGGAALDRESRIPVACRLELPASVGVRCQVKRRQRWQRTLSTFTGRRRWSSKRTPRSDRPI
jgi:hypothetical protein